MAGIGGSHVRAATAFVRSARFVRYSPVARALWLHLHAIAIDMKAEFLPEEYTVDEVARDFARPPDETQAALDELVGATGLRRPIINTIEIDFGDGPVMLIRARGAREKQPVGWKDESDLARAWNEANPEDQVILEGFERYVVNRRTEEGGSQPKGQKKVPQTRTKRKPKAARSQSKRNGDAPQTVGNVLANASQVPDIREEKTRENKHLQRECAANAGDSSPPLPSGASTAANGNDNNGDGAPDPRLVSRFDKLIAGWGKTNDDAPRKRALMFLSADPPRVIAHVMEIDSDVQKYPTPWAELGHRLTKVIAPEAEYTKRAEKLIAAVTK